jgi:hypothetical protein
MPIYNVPCLLQVMDVNGDGTDDLLIGEPTRNANKLEIINDGNGVLGFFFHFLFANVWLLDYCTLS